jgi:hypothetical protein
VLPRGGEVKEIIGKRSVEGELQESSREPPNAQGGTNELIRATGDILRGPFWSPFWNFNGIFYSIISSISSKLVQKIFNVVNNGMFYSKHNQFQLKSF